MSIHVTGVVLTAAHCLEGNQAAQALQNQGFGIFFISATDVYYALNNGSYLAMMEADDLIPHPSYTGNNNIRYDIGLMHLTSPITNITPMPLNTSSPTNSWSEITYVGFGVTGPSQEGSGVRRTVEVPFYGVDSQFIYTKDPSGQ